MSTNLAWTRVDDLAYFQQRAIFENQKWLGSFEQICPDG